MSKFRPNNNNNNNGSQPQQQRVPIATNGPSYMVQQMAAQNFAMRNGGQLPTTMAGSPNGNAPAVAAAPMNMNFFQQNGGATGKYEAPVVQQEPDLTPSTPAPAPEYGTDGVQFANPSQPQQNDMDSLSAALNGAGVSHPQQQVPEFHADPSQRDGGFFGWLSGLIPKNRPGMREGETPDEYDRRITTNRERIAAFADAIRHMANIVNTAKGAPLQQFNDPTSMLEQGYQNRMAQRAQKAAADASAAYKMANLSLKERAAEADRAYKQLNLNLKQQAADRAAKSDDFNQRYKEAGLQRQLDNDKFNHDLAGKKFDETKRHNEVSEGQSAARIALAQERNEIARARLAHSIATGGSGGGGGKGGSLTNLSSPSGHLNRKKDLNSIEKKQITQHLIQNGYINKKNLDAYKMYQSMGNTQLANDLQNYWIAYAANTPGKKGDAFRSMLKNHYMYGETSTVSTTKAQPKSAPKKTTSGKPVGGGVSGGKSKNGYKNTKALGL